MTKIDTAALRTAYDAIGFRSLGIDTAERLVTAYLEALPAWRQLEPGDPAPADKPWRIVLVPTAAQVEANVADASAGILLTATFLVAEYLGLGAGARAYDVHVEVME